MLSEKIVVVDDDPRIIKSITMGLMEYEIKEFRNGEDALTYLRKPSLINVVVLDVMMPGLDGMTVLNEIRKINKEIAVIIMTAYGSKDLAIQAVRGKADDFIEKPFDVDILRDKIKDILKEKLRYQEGSTDRENQVQRIKSFVDRNYKNANLEYLANELCLSPKYISRMFNRASKSSFRDYKVKVKMDKAKQLLKKSSLNVSEIAIELGYQNPESFMRIFKRMTKMTPSQYKKNGAKKK